MDRQLHISRVIFVSMADGTERCFHWQNHDHDVFYFFGPSAAGSHAVFAVSQFMALLRVSPGSNSYPNLICLSIMP